MTGLYLHLDQMLAAVGFAVWWTIVVKSFEHVLVHLVSWMVIVPENVIAGVITRYRIRQAQELAAQFTHSTACSMLDFETWYMSRITGKKLD